MKFWSLIQLLSGAVLFEQSFAAMGQAVQSESAEFKQGAELARKYCASCHLFTDPVMLDKQTWREGTLPMMRKQLGIDLLDPADPSQKKVLEEWDLIWKYYLEAAPSEALPQAAKPAVRLGLKQFKVITPNYRPGKQYVTLLQVDPGAKQIYVGNAETKTLDVLDSDGKLLSSLSLESPPVSLTHRTNGWFCTLIGLVPPHDKSLGKLVLLDKSADAFTRRADVAANLPRPTDCSFGDLNGDGLEDFVLSGFGNRTGKLSWHENLGGGKYAEHIIYDRPGALRSELHDFDRDGRLDIIVLMAQGREGVYLLLNDGGGKFTELPIVEQPPVWGYAGFQVVDFDRDGRLDILTANGDNGEYPSCLKNYHGIRLYLNRSERGFEPAFFYPLHGAFKALAADFDKDGDLDIAAIAYFPDYAGAPEESFVYLENQGGLKFTASSFPQAQLGRWLVMDVGDLDGDGDVDIVLGAANRTPYKVSPALFERWQKEGPSILILQNMLRQ